MLPPHQVESSTLTIVYSWPNQFYQENPERAAHMPSWISIASDNTFGSVENPEESESPVPSEPAPRYQTLSSCPPHFQLEQHFQFHYLHEHHQIC